jgi:hypothetical protein
LHVSAILIICNAVFCIFEFCMVLSVNGYYFLKHTNQSIFVMVKCGVLFEVRAEYLNIT